MSSGVGILLTVAGMTLGAALGWIVSQRAMRARLAEQERTLEKALIEARTDSLTSLRNRKAFDEHLAAFTAVARRYGGPLSLVLFDMDGLKSINDVRGHAAGDAALVLFAQVLRESSRDSDVVARMGGDEFAALLPQTDGAGAVAFAERIRKGLSSIASEAAAPGSSEPAATAAPEGTEVELVLRVSAGIAEFQPEMTTADLFQAADAALYRTKPHL